MATNDGFFDGNLPPKGPPNPIGCIPLKKRFLWPYKHPLNEDQPPATETKPPDDEAPKTITPAPVPIAPVQEKPPISEPSTFVLPPKPPELADEVEGPSAEVRGLPLKYAMKKRLPGEGGFWGASTSNGTNEEDGMQHGALKVCRKKKIYNSTPIVNVNLPPRYIQIPRHMPSPRHVASSGFIMGTKYGSNGVVKRKRATPWVPQKLKPPVRQSSRLRNKRAAKTFLAKMAASSPGRDGTKGKSSKDKPGKTSAKKDVDGVTEDCASVEESSTGASDVKSSVDEVICTAGSSEPSIELPVIMEEPEEVKDNPTDNKVQEIPEAPPPPPDPDPVSDPLIDVEDEEEGPLVIDEGPDEPPPPPPLPPPFEPPPPQTEPQELANLPPEEPTPVSSVPEDQAQVVEEPLRERLSLKIIVPKPKKSKRKKKSKSHKSDREHKDKEDKEKHRSKEERSKHKDKEDRGKRKDKEEKAKHREKEREKVKEVEEEIEEKIEEKVEPEPVIEEEKQPVNVVEETDKVIEEEVVEEKEKEPEPVIPVVAPEPPTETTLEEDKLTEPEPEEEQPKMQKKKKKNGPKVVISTKGDSNQWTCSLQTSPLIKKCKDCRVVLNRLPDKLLYMQPPVAELCANEATTQSTNCDIEEAVVIEDQVKKKPGKKKINRTKSKAEKAEETTDIPPAVKEGEENSIDDVIEGVIAESTESTTLAEKQDVDKEDEKEPSPSAREKSVSPPPPAEPSVKPKVKKPRRGPKSKTKQAKIPAINTCIDLSSAKEATQSPSAVSDDAQQDPASTVSASVKNCVPPSYARVMEADTDNSLNLIQEEFRGMKHGESRVIVLTKKQYDMEGKQAEILREFSDHGVPKVELIDVNHVSTEEKELPPTAEEKSQKGGKFFSDFRKRSVQPGVSAVSRYIQKSASSKKHSAGESRKLILKSSKDTKRKSDLSESTAAPKKMSNSWKKAVMDQIKLFNQDPKGSDSETESTATPSVNSRPPPLLSPRQPSVPSSPLPLSSPSITSPRHMMMMKDSGNYANQVAGWVSDISDDDDSPRKALLASSEDGFKIPSHPLPSPHTTAPSPASQEFRTPNDLPKSRRFKRQDSDLKSTPSHLSSSDVSEWECEMMHDTKDSPNVPTSPKLMADPSCFLNRTKASLKQAPAEILNKQQQPLIKKPHKVVKEPKEKVKNPRKKGRRVKGKFRMEGKDDPTYMPGAPKDSLLIEEESESDVSEEEPPPPPVPAPPPPLGPSEAGYPYLSPANAPSPFWKPGEPLEGKEEYARLAHSDDEQEQYEVSDEAFNARLYALYRHDRFKTRSGAKLRQIVDFTNVDWLERQQSSKGSSLSLEDRDLYSDDPSSPANTPLSKKKSRSVVSEERHKHHFKMPHNDDEEDDGPPHLSPIRMDAPHNRRVCESDNDFPKLDSEHYSDCAGMLANLHSGDHVSSASEADDLTGRSTDVPFQRTEYKRRMKELYERSKKCKRKSDTMHHDNKRRKGVMSDDDDSAVHVPSPASEDDEFYSTSNMHYRRQYAPSECGSSDSEQFFLDKDLEILIRDAVTLSRDLEERLLRDPRGLALYLDRMMQGTRTLCGDIEEQQQMPPCSPPLADILPVGILEEEDDYGGLSVADLLSQEVCTEAQDTWQAYECCMEENSMDRLLSQPSGKHFGCSPLHDPFFDSDSVDDFFLGSRHDDPDFATLGKYGEQSNESYMWANVDSTVDLSW